MEWRISTNLNPTKPDAVQFDYNCDTVYVRRNFTKKEEQNDGRISIPEHWEYDEIKVPLETWEFMKTLIEHTGKINESQDAATEIASIAADNTSMIEELQAAIAELGTVSK